MVSWVVVAWETPCGKTNSQTEDITFPQQNEIYETQLKFNCDLHIFEEI